MELLGKIKHIVVHHTERVEDFPLFVKFRHKHRRGWEDIGYHYLIGRKGVFTSDGKLYRGRSEEFQGAHVLGHNKNSLGVCLIGNFDQAPPSKRQLITLISFLKRKIRDHNIPIENIRGHNEFGGVTKSCPGKFVDMDFIRSLLS